MCVCVILSSYRGLCMGGATVSQTDVCSLQLPTNDVLFFTGSGYP